MTPILNHAATPAPSARRLRRLAALAVLLLPSLAFAQLRAVETFHGTFVECDASTGIAQAGELSGVPVSMQFEMIHNADGTWSFKRGDVYLTAEIETMNPDGSAVSVSCNRTALGAWEKFTLVETGSAGIYAFQSYHGYFMAAEPDGRLVANRAAVGGWEGFGFWTLGNPNWWNRRSLVEFCDGAPFEPAPEAPPPPPPPPPPSRAIRTTHDTWLYCDAGVARQTGAFEDPVGAAVPSGGRWSMLDNADGTWSLQTVGGAFLTAAPDGSLRCDAAALGPWEKFGRTNVEGSTTFEGAHGYFVSAQDDGSVVADREAALAWEEFELWRYEAQYVNWWTTTYSATSPE